MQNLSHVGNPNHRVATSRWPRACWSFNRRLGRPRAALPTSISKWEGSSNAVPDAMVAHLGTHMLRPGNDPEVVARKLLREKHGRTSFYAAISYRIGAGRELMEMAESYFPGRPIGGVPVEIWKDSVTRWPAIRPLLDCQEPGSPYCAIACFSSRSASGFGKIPFLTRTPKAMSAS